jgi:DNA gyrase subunit A
MKLPLAGLEDFVRRAGRPEAEIAEAAKRKEYFLSERQAKAILEMRLSRLTGLEREKLAKDYGSLCDLIARLSAILGDMKLLMDVVVKELEEIKGKYTDARRTEIVATEAEINMEDLVQEEDMVVTISHAGYIKRTPCTTYRAQRRGGRGKVGMEAREEDFVNQLFVASTHAFVFFFSDRGKVYVKKVYEIPAAARNAKGRAIVNFVGIEPGEKIAAIMPVIEMKEQTFVVTLTKRGQIKKTEVTEYENFREKGIIGVKIEDGDQLLGAAITDGTRDIIIATKQGMSIRFDEKQVRPMGRSTVGVKAIDLSEGDHVVGLGVTSDGEPQVLAVCEKGFGKRTPLEEFRPQNRGGGDHPHRQRAQRSGGGHRARQTGQRGHARHRSRSNAAHQGQRDPRDGAQRARRAGDDRRRRGTRRRHRGARRVRRRGCAVHRSRRRITPARRQHAERRRQLTTSPAPCPARRRPSSPRQARSNVSTRPTPTRTAS